VYRIFNLFFVTASPGLHRLAPVLVIPLFFGEDASIIQLYSLAGVLSFFSAMGFVNVLYGLPSCDRKKFITSYQLLMLALLSFSVLAMLVFRGGYTNALLVVPLWLYGWGMYQVLRAYLLSKDCLGQLALLETVFLGCLCLVVFFLYLFEPGAMGVVLGLLLVPYLVVQMVFFREVDFLLASLKGCVEVVLSKGLCYFSFANFFSASPMLLMPVIYSYFEVNDRDVVFAGVVSTVLSVAMLVGRVLSNYYLPRMSNAVSPLPYLRSFLVYNTLSLVFICPLLFVFLEFGFDVAYPEVVTSSSGYILVGCVVSFAFSQFVLPHSNYIVVSNKSGFLFFVNFVCFVLFCLGLFVVWLVGGEVVVSVVNLVAVFSLLRGLFMSVQLYRWGLYA